MKIFWSWQSDTPQGAGRHFVRAALDAAAQQLADHPDLEDAERPQIDSDTANVPGSPPIAETILGKIRDCAVFVADVTPVGQTTGGKKLANPNVMIELGYALRCVGATRIVLVMNQTEGGGLKHLPFDLRHWRGPITYSLSKTATDEQRAQALESLTGDLVARLAPSLAVSVSIKPAAAPPPIVAADPDDSSVWAGGRTGFVVTTDTYGQMTLKFDDEPKLYCRIIPAAPIEVTRRDMTQMIGQNLALSPLGDYASIWNGTSEEGAVAFNWVTNQRVYAATQWFQANGEIWGVCADVVKELQNRRYFTDGWAARSLEAFIVAHRRTLTHSDATKPWQFIIGASGLKGSLLPGGRSMFGGRPAVADAVRHEAILNDPSDENISDLCWAFFRKLYDAYGAPNLDKAGYATVLTRD